MKYIILFILAFTVYSNSVADTLCSTTQITYFNCQLKKSKDMVAICGKKGQKVVNFRYGNKRKLIINYTERIGDLYDGDIYLHATKNSSGLHIFSLDFVIFRDGIKNPGSYKDEIKFLKADDLHYDFSVYNYNKPIQSKFDSVFIIDSFMHGTPYLSDECKKVNDFQQLELLLPYSSNKEYFDQ